MEPEPGRYWTYVTEGRFAAPGDSFSPLREFPGHFTVILGQADPGGRALTDRCEMDYDREKIAPIHFWSVEGFLDWPLEEGKTWMFRTDSWDLRATVTEIRGDQAKIVVQDRKGDRHRIEYDGSVGWFSTWEDVRRDRSYTLQAHGWDYTGRVCEAVRSTLLDHRSKDGVEERLVAVPEGDALRLRFNTKFSADFPGGAGTLRVDYSHPATDEYILLYDDTATCAVASCGRGGGGETFLHPIAGEWRWRTVASSYDAALVLDHFRFNERQITG